MPNIKRQIIAFFSLLLLGGCSGYTAFVTPAPTGLLCELLEAPQTTVITDPQPELSWIVNANRNNDRQTAYQVLFASSPDLIRSEKADLWDSGKVDSNQSSAVSYQGQPLQSHSSYYWAVRTWNRDGRHSSYSTIQQFNTGELQQTPLIGQNKWVQIQNLPGQPWALENRHNIESHEFKPVKMIKKSPGHYFIDFGLARFATLKFTVTYPNDGKHYIVPPHITMNLGELATDEHTISMNPPSPFIIHENHELPLEPGTHTYTLQLPRHKSTIKKHTVYLPEHLPEVTPFRYAEMMINPSTFKISNIRQLALNYRFNDHAANFDSSDPVLNDVWQLCTHTIKACSFLGTYIDGNRERRPYEGDTFINQLGHYYIDREYALARHSHEYLLTHPTWPTEYTMLSVLIAWNDYLYTGDKDSLRNCYNDLKVKTLFELARPDGLIAAQDEDRSNIDNYKVPITPAPYLTEDLNRRLHNKQQLCDIVDWKPIPRYRDDYDFKKINTVVNTFHYRALVLMTSIAETLNQHDDARFFEQRSNRVKASFNEKLFDSSTGLYVDGEGSAHSSLHANFFPLAFGLVPQQQRQTVIEFIRSKGMRCSPYTANFLLEALYLNEQADYALDLLTAKNDTSWFNMIKMGSTMTTEAWDLSHTQNMHVNNIDFNHPWAAAPANIIPRFVMGIRPVVPGFGKILIHPQPASLKQASIDTPTVKGNVHVDFKNNPSQKFVLNINIPANTTARVVLPCLNEKNNTVQVDGHHQTAVRHGDTLVLDDIPSGSHTFVLKR